MADIQENVIEWITGDEKVSVTFTQQKFRSKLRKLHERMPEAFDGYIEDENGYTWAKIPASWISVSKPRKVNLTEEQREERRRRMAAVRERLSRIQ